MNLLIDRRLEENSNLDLKIKYSDILNTYCDQLALVLMEAKEKDVNDIPVTFLLRQFAENVDAISVLVRQGCIDGCSIILRTLYDLFFQMDYLFKGNLKENIRTFIFHQYLTEYNALTHYLEGHSNNTKYQKLKSENEFKFEPNIPADIQTANEDRIKALEFAMDLPEFRKQRMYLNPPNGGVKPNLPNYWFSYFKRGPNNYKELCDKLKKPLFYFHIFSPLSDATHGGNIFKQKLIFDENGAPSAVKFRDLRNIATVTHDVVVVSEMAIELYLTEYIPEFRENILPSLSILLEKRKELFPQTS